MRKEDIIKMETELTRLIKCAREWRHHDLTTDVPALNGVRAGWNLAANEDIRKLDWEFFTKGKYGKY